MNELEAREYLYLLERRGKALKITPKCAGVEPFEITGDWVYVPQYGCWYGSGKSFMSDICEVVNDMTEI